MNMLIAYVKGAIPARLLIRDVEWGKSSGMTVTTMPWL
jgi:hypothetical protein